jgi:hypothetical protein
MADRDYENHASKSEMVVPNPMDFNKDPMVHPILEINSDNLNYGF